MLKIQTYLVSVYVLFLFWGVCGEEPKGQNINEGKHVADDSNSLSEKIPEDSASKFPEVPYPKTIDENQGSIDDNDQVPTPTADSVVIVAGGAGGAAAPVVIPTMEDVSSMDATGNNLENDTDLAGASALPKAVPTQTDIPKTNEDQTDSSTAPENKEPVPLPSVSNSITAESLETEEQVNSDVAAAKDTEEASFHGLPGVSQTMDEYLQTQIFRKDFSQPQDSSSSVDSPTFDPLQATEALKSINPGTWEGLSKLPIGMGGMAVEPHFVQESVSSTAFSMEEALEDGKKVEGEEDFPTFDKWSVQYLAEQEKQKIEKEQEQAVNPNTVLAQKKLRQNFAAATCGAKVVASNAEAENINFLLNGNPDEYMISPCKAKKWFVVELCEPLQIHKVDIGTMELFSSQPKSFRLFSSQRYPTKEWIPLGKYEMTPERIVQSFHTVVAEEFVKFVKVELVDHHGNEHYCPVTTFRVLGIDMASEEDDESEPESAEAEGQEMMGDKDDDGAEGSVNLFTSAKETVVKLVKKVLYKGDSELPEKGEGEKEEEGIAQKDNATEKTEEKKGESGDAPCPDKIKTADVPTAVIPDVGSIPPPTSKEPEEVPIITKLTDTEQLPMDTTEKPMIIKLEQEPGDELSGYHSASTCYHSPLSSYALLMSPTIQSVYTCAVRKGKPLAANQKTSSEIPIDLIKKDETERLNEKADTIVTQPAEKEANEKDETSEDSKLSQPVEKTVAETVAEDDEGKRKTSGQEDPNSKEDKELLGKTSQEQQKEPEEVKPTTEDTQQVEIDKQKPDEAVFSSQSTSFSDADVSATKSETLEPSSISSQADIEKEVASAVTPGLDIQQSRVVEHGATDLSETIFLKVSPSPTSSSEDSLVGPGDASQESPFVAKLQDDNKFKDTPQLADDLEKGQGQDQSSQKIVVKPSGEAQVSSSHAGDQQTKGQAEKINATETGSVPSSAKTGRAADLVKVGMPSNAKRDVSLMKLNNRIVALEQNVSMTKKYLEELSRAFKQQNEEMMKLLNKTEKRLTAYMAQAEERDMIQQAQIDVLEQKVANLTRAMDTMQIRIETMGKELHDGQFMLAFFQAVLFCWLIISTYRNRTKPSLTYTDHQFLLDTMPSQPNLTDNVEGRVRSNSDVGMKSGLQNSSTIKRRTSEINLVVAKEENDIHLPTQASKKKKKKKLKQVVIGEYPVSSQPAAISPQSVPIQSPSFSSCAGVLFGAANTHSHPAVSSAEDLTRQRFETNKENLQSVNNSDSFIWPTWSKNVTSPGERCSIDAGTKVDLGNLALRQTNSQVLFVGASDAKSSNFPLTKPVPFPVIKYSPTSSNPWRWEIDETDSSQSVETPMSCALSPSKGDFLVEKSNKNSPEFKMPPYHRHKRQRVGENNSFDFRLGSMRGKQSSLDEAKMKQSRDFINPRNGGEFFLAENYLSENRFKFPASPAKNYDRESELSAFIRQNSSGPCGAMNEPVNHHGQPLMSFKTNPVHALPPPSHVPQHPSRSPSWSSLSSSSNPSLGPGPSSPTSSPSSLLLDQNNARLSFINSSYLSHSPPPPHPPSLSFLSSQNLPICNSNDHCLSPSDSLSQEPTLSPARELKPSSTISSKSSTKLNLPPSGASCVKGTYHIQGSGGKKNNSPKTHRRQGSFPEELNGGKQNNEKQGQTRQGSLDGTKLTTKSFQSNPQGSRSKKMATNCSGLSRKGSGSKAVDPTTSQTRKGAKH